MSLAAALILGAASALVNAPERMAERPAQRPGVIAMARAEAVILRPAQIRRSDLDSRPDRDQLFHQRSEGGGRILFEFN